MSDRGFTENFIQGNWHHLTGTGNSRNKSWSQTATTRRNLQIYLPATMRNLIQIFCPNLPVFYCSISAQFTCLLYIPYSSAPCMQRPLSTGCHVTMTYLFLRLTYPSTLNFNYRNQHCVSPRTPRPDATRQRGYNQARNILRGLVRSSFFGLHTLN
jgi:hypothetical protein